MPLFEVLPTDPSGKPMQFSAPDAAEVLLIVQRCGCGEADVHNDGQYAFSVSVDDAGVWKIFHRQEVANNSRVDQFG